MTENLRPVSSCQMFVSYDAADVLVAYGVGSCIVICLYDTVESIGGMLHALLPSAQSNGRAVNNPAKFVDQGLLLMINTMVSLGAKPTRMVAKLVGGASILTISEFNNTFRIGQRNIKCAEATLKTAKIPITGQATGGSVGRTIKFQIANGQVITRTLRQKEQRI